MLGAGLPFWSRLLKTAHQSHHWEPNKGGGCACSRLEIGAINWQVGHQPWCLRGKRDTRQDPPGHPDTLAGCSSKRWW